MNFFQEIFYLLTGIALVVGLSMVWWRQWVRHKNTEFINSIKWVMLEIRLPREVFKSPLAMELVLNSIYQGGGHGNDYQRYWQGRVRNWISLEIASIEGEIHFFIRANSKFKNSIEATIYSQYPGIEITEVEDYTNFTRYDPEKKNLWGNEFVLTGADFIPIRTYVDYGLDRDPKEEYKIDPITPLLEWMGSIGKGEQIWYQIITRADTTKWHETGKAEIDKIHEIQEITDEKGKKKKVQGKKATDLTVLEKERVESIQRNISKFGFEVGIRVLYITDKDKFNAKNIDAATGCMRQYGWQNFNGFRPANTTSFDYPWQDPSGKKEIGLKYDIFKSFVLRKYFYSTFSDSGWFDEVWYNTHKSVWDTIKVWVWPPEHKNGFILNSEELATIYHFPGKVANTPSFKRISSTKAEPPSNLPL